MKDTRADYIEVLKRSVSAIMKQSGIDPSYVIGIGIDFTACTMLQVDTGGEPLCFKPELKDQPHSWLKLWKHHAAQNEANLINEIAKGQIADSKQTPALGAAMFGAVAAGADQGGYDSIVEAAQKMARVRKETYKPIPQHVEVYEKLYQEYAKLHDYFGRGDNNVMKTLKAMKEAR